MGIELKFKKPLYPLYLPHILSFFSAMALLLNIETATSTGSVCLSQEGSILSERGCGEQKDHAAVLVPFIKEMLLETEVTPAQLDAIVISGGPGSYTGLRVAASTAKGLCYAWNIPLIAISTLKAMASGMSRLIGEHSDALLCPMIDARRMEVFTALFDGRLDEILAPQPLILQADFLSEFKDRNVLVAGTGKPKAEKLLKGNPWTFLSYGSHAAHLVTLGEAAFKQKQFVDAAYFEPYYLKSVYLPKKK